MMHAITAFVVKAISLTWSRMPLYLSPIPRTFKQKTRHQQSQWRSSKNGGRKDQSGSCTTWPWTWPGAFNMGRNLKYCLIIEAFLKIMELAGILGNG
jgi:hypothetical protein